MSTGSRFGAALVVALLPLATLSAQCPVNNLNATTNCTTGGIDVSWDPIPYMEMRVRAVTSAGAVAGEVVLTPAAPANQATLLVPGGNYQVQVRRTCAAGQSTFTMPHAHATAFTDRSNVIVGVEGPGGAIDSAGEWSNFFASTSKDHVNIGAFDELCPSALGVNDVVWVCAGTFPHNYVLTVQDGELLRDLVLQGVGVYLEGADLWGFDPLTPYADYDGVHGRFGFPSPIENGDDSCQMIEGLAHAGMDLTGWTQLYDQDQPGNDSTDRLIPTGVGPMVQWDLSGPNAGVVIQKVPSPNYGVAVYYVPDPGPAPLGFPIQGPRVSSSIEGGKHDDSTKTEVMLCLKGFVAEDFVRGDCNGDGVCNVADAVALLQYLFTMADDPPCFDACDMTDDGAIDLGDAIYKVIHLFTGGPPPEPPFPGCGPDPEFDLLNCAESGVGC